MITRTSRFGVFLLVCVPLATGCSSNRLETGPLHISMSGDVVENVEGVSMCDIVTVHEDGRQAFKILGQFLEPKPEDDVFVLMWDRNTIPGAGEYTIPENVSLFYQKVSAAKGTSFPGAFGESGTVTITDSNENRVSGSFSAAANFGNKRVSIKGSFDSPHINLSKPFRRAGDSFYY